MGLACATQPRNPPPLLPALIIGHGNSLVFQLDSLPSVQKQANYNHPKFNQRGGGGGRLHSEGQKWRASQGCGPAAAPRRLPPAPAIQETADLHPRSQKQGGLMEYCDVSWWVGVKQPAGFGIKDIFSGEVGGRRSVRSPSASRFMKLVCRLDTQSHSLRLKL